MKSTAMKNTVMKRKVMERLAAAALATVLLAPAASAQIRTGMTVAEFEAAATADLAAQGDRMGYALTPCALRPAFGSGQTYLSRAVSKDPAMTILLADVTDGKVTRHQEFALPDIEGWITHMVHRCEGSRLRIGTGTTQQVYAWRNGRFTKRGKR